MKKLTSIAHCLTNRATVAALAIGLGMSLFANPASANLGAGSVILNVARLTYKDASGAGSYAATSSATTTVNLVPSTPTVSAPGDQTVNSGATATYTYQATATANGSAAYAIGSAFTGTTNLNGAQTAVPSVASVTLGASVITAVPAADQVTIPAGSGTNLVVGDIIVIGGTDFAISAITAGTIPSHTTSGTSSTDGTTTNEIGRIITVIANAAGSNTTPAFAAGLIGSVAGERQTFTVAVTATTNLAGTGTGTVNTTVGVATPDDTVTTFLAPNLSILKEVRNVTASGSFAATATGVTADVLEYRITMTNNGLSNATTAALTDAVPVYTTYVANSTLLNSITVAGDGATSPLSAGLAVDANGSRGAGVAATGIIAPAGVATVIFRVTIQ